MRDVTAASHSDANVNGLERVAASASRCCCTNAHKDGLVDLQAQNWVSRKVDRFAIDADSTLASLGEGDGCCSLDIEPSSEVRMLWFITCLLSANET